MNTIQYQTDLKSGVHSLQAWTQQEVTQRYGRGRRMIHGMSVDFSLFLTYSFAGWLWESTVCSLYNYGKLINRGFLNGPYCPIYGCGGLLAVHLLSELEHPSARFLASGTLCCALEYATSWGMEKLFHARWWDYSDKPFNLNGRIYLNGFLAFGAAASLLVNRVDPKLRERLNLLPPVLLDAVAGATFLGFAADNAITLLGFMGFSHQLEQLAAILESGLEQLPTSERIRSAYDRMSTQQRRILSAFPRLRAPANNHALSAIRHLISERNGQYE